MIFTIELNQTQILAACVEYVQHRLARGFPPETPVHDLGANLLERYSDKSGVGPPASQELIVRIDVTEHS